MLQGCFVYQITANLLEYSISNIGVIRIVPLSRNVKNKVPSLDVSGPRAFELAKVAVSEPIPSVKDSTFKCGLMYSKGDKLPADSVQ